MPKDIAKKISIEDESLYTKFVIAAFFMFIIPLLLTLYVIFIVLFKREMAASMGYTRLIIFWMIVSGVFGYIIIKKTIKSIIDLINKAKQISEGRLGEKIEVFHQDELKDLAGAFNRITSDLERKIKELEYSRSLARELFQKIGHAITSSQKMDALLSLIVQSMRKVLKANASFVALHDRKNGRLYLKAYSGTQKDLSDNMELPDDKGVIGLVIKNVKPMMIKKPASEARSQPGEDVIEYSSILCVPIIEKGKAKGILGIADQKDTENIETEDLFLLENIANQIAASVENFELNKDIEETYYQTLLMLARVVEAKDPYSEGHLERVADYVGLIAGKLKMDEETKKVLVGGAVLHDLGKVGIQDNVLKKEDKLSPDEYEIMKQHSVIGENILKPLRSMSKLSKLVRHHHELYDGSGYPDGLKGEEIPLLSRILTVADIYDAITTDRPYRKAMSRDQAIKVLKSYAGNKLDPKLTDLFIELIQSSGKKETK